jgi:hypothetical protein
MSTISVGTKAQWVAHTCHFAAYTGRKKKICKNVIPDIVITASTSQIKNV